MNLFYIFCAGAFLFPIFVATYLDVTTIDELLLDTNKEIYAGEGEVCITPYTKINCVEGLKCVLLSTTPHVNGVCLYEEDVNLSQDFTNRGENEMKNKTLNSDYVDFYKFE